MCEDLLWDYNITTVNMQGTQCYTSMKLSESQKSVSVVFYKGVNPFHATYFLFESLITIATKVDSPHTAESKGFF